jgi:hypothetical protein
MSKYKDSIERIKPCLFVDEDSYPVKLSEYEIAILKRLMAGYSYSLRWPQKGDKQVVDFLKRVFKIEKTQAYIDLRHIKELLGDIKIAGKEWQRHTVIEMAKVGWEIARKKEDSVGMAAHENVIGRFTKLDQEEAEQIPWDKLFMSLLEPTNDPSILNIKNMKDAEARKQKLFKKYYPEVEEAHEV